MNKNLKNDMFPEHKATSLYFLLESGNSKSHIWTFGHIWHNFGANHVTAHTLL